MALLYWSIGQGLHNDPLGGDRATYGAEVVTQLGIRLSEEFGRGFEAKNLRRMANFARVFPDPEIIATLSRQLAWSHIKELLPLKDPSQRAFYAKIAGEERWSVRELRGRIESTTWERTSIQGQAPEDTLVTTGTSDPLAPSLVNANSKVYRGRQSPWPHQGQTIFLSKKALTPQAKPSGPSWKGKETEPKRMPVMEPKSHAANTCLSWR